MKYKITENEANQRFDRFLRKYFKHNSKIHLADIFMRIRKGFIVINGKKRPVNYKLRINDIVSLKDGTGINTMIGYHQKNKEEKIQKYTDEEIKSMILYEDSNRIVFNKPPGIVMHPGTGHMNTISMHDLLHAYLRRSKKNIQENIFLGNQQLLHDFKHSSTFSPSFGFRLDKDTSGVVIGSKTYSALQYLNKCIREKKTKKVYLAIVSGIFSEHKIIELPLFKGFDKKIGKAKMFIHYEKGVYAKTVVKCITHIKHESLGDISLVHITIHTGRMHQIRTHLAFLGHPIIGDILYGNPTINRIAYKKNKIRRQLLHSKKYGFFNIFTNKQIEFTAPTPKEFYRLFSNI